MVLPVEGGGAPSAVLKWVRILLVVLNQGTQAMVLGGVALFLPLIRPELGLTFAEGGGLAAACTLTYAIMQIPAGHLADRFRPKRVFDIGLIGIVVLLFAFCLQTDFTLMLMTMGAIGFFRSLMFASGMQLMTAQFRDDRRALASGLYVAGGFSANIFLSIFGPLLVGPLGWRLTFAIFIAIAGGLLLLHITLGHPGPTRTKAHRVLLPPGVGNVFASAALWICCWVQFVRFAVANAITLWTPSFLVDEKGLTLEAAGWIIALGAGLTALSNVYGGLVSDILRRPTYVVLVAVAVLAVTLALIPVAPMWAVIVLVLVQAAFIQVYFGPIFEIPLLFISRDFAGLVTGIGNMFANVGALVSSIALGAVMDATGTFALGFQGLAVLCVTAILAAFVLVRMDAKRRATITRPVS
ncbi:MAG TPA: MFS transporter [Microbacteriaceae bacterium]|nr:MFS transporter [Microbacteriaceae bacterium]